MPSMKPAMAQGGAEADWLGESSLWYAGGESGMTGE